MRWPWALGCLLLGLDAQGLETYGVEHGLSQNSVVAIATDARGFLWLGTEDGLNRFDGHGFKVFRHEPGQPGLSDSFVQRLARVGEVLWIGTVGGGLSRMDLSTERISGLREVLPRHELSGHTIEALRALDPQRVLVAALGKLWLLEWDGASHVEVRPLALPVSAARVRALSAHPDGGTVVGGDGVLCALDPELQQCAPLRLPGVQTHELKIQVMAVDSSSLWLAIEGFGLLRHSSTEGAVKHWRFGHELPSPMTRILALAAAPDGGVWIGSDLGTWLWRATCDCIDARFDRLPWGAAPHRLTYALEPGPDGSVWIGFWNQGLARHDPKRAGNLGFRGRLEGSTELNVAQIRGFAFARDRLWLASYGLGVIEAQPVGEGAYRFRQPDALRPQSATERFVWALLRDPLGRLWVGSDAGLTVIDPLTGQRQRVTTADGSSLSAVRVLLLDRRGRLWVGSERGLYRLEEAKPAQHAEAIAPSATLALVDPRVFALHEDADGRLWIGTWSGVHALAADGTDLRPVLAAEAGVRLVWDLAAGHDGGLWIGTSDGLIHARRDGSWRRYTEAHGLANRVIYGIEADHAGALWLSSNRGLMRFDPVQESVVNFGLSDGLVQNEFLFGGHARDPEGRIWFGGLHGFQRIDPQIVVRDDQDPRPVLTEVRVDGQTLEAGDPRMASAAPALEHLRLAPGDRVLELHYAAIAFDQPRDVRFRYRLLGFDQGWQEARDRRLAVYTGLPPGRYRFEIQAIGRSGRASEVTRQLEIEQGAHWWQLRSVQISGWMLAVLSVLLVLWWRISDLRAQRAILERTVAERTRELAEQSAALRRLNQELEQLSTRDPLTGLANRRALLAQLGQDLKTVAAKQHPLCVVLFDLDHFKRINDSRGHGVGDRVLAALGPLWRPALPDGALLGRYGGEEFLLLLPGVSATRACTLVEGLLERLRSAVIDPKHPELKVTSSAGVAAWQGASERLEQLIHRADDALYRAKAAGRDRLVLAT